jgi:hypothetical protein
LALFLFLTNLINFEYECKLLVRTSREIAFKNVKPFGD